MGGIRLAVLAAMAVAAPASAVTYRFEVVQPDAQQSGRPLDGNRFVFFADSAPVNPEVGGGFFTIPATLNYTVTFSPGAVSQYTVPSLLNFYVDTQGGGFDNGSGLGVFGGPQLFDGDLSAPVFRLGGSLFANGASVTVTAPAPAAVPEPATWAAFVLGFGLLGASLRRRRAAIRA